MSGLIPGVRNNGVILVGLAALPGSTQMLVVTAEGLLESQAIPGGSGSVTWEDVSGKPAAFPPSAHDHNDLYYTEYEINLLLADFATDAELANGLAGKANASHVHGNITNAGAIGSTANLPLITTAGGVITTGSFGTAAGTFCQGNDSRLSNASTLTTGTLDDARLSSNVARRNQANTFTGLQTISEGVANTQVQISDDGVLISRTLDGLYAASIVRGSGSTANALVLDYEANAGHQFKTGGVTRVALGAGVVATTGGTLSVNTLAICTNWSASANVPLTVTTDDAAGSALGFVVNRTNRSASGANAIQMWQWNGTERARIRTDGGFVSVDVTATGLMCAGVYTVGTLPSASANAGKFAQVTDSSVTTFGSTVAGGGSNRRQVFSDGTNWIIH